MLIQQIAQAKRILIVEDDQITSICLKHQLEKQSFVVHQDFTGNTACRKAIQHQPDCIFLDVCLPKINGYQLCEKLREFYHGPIIFLTSDDAEETEIKCLQLGADDVIHKDRSFAVILARVLRLLEKKTASTTTNTYEIGTFKFDSSNRICEFKGQEVLLTNDEYQLLYYLLAYQDKLVTREQTYQTLKGISYNGVNRSMDISISRLKSKLVKAGINSDIIQAVRSQGYRLSTLPLMPQQHAV